MEPCPLQVDNLGKAYNRTPVLKDVSFALASGEAFGLIGLNGAGKSTLIKIALDLVRADGGETRLFGVPSRDWRARAQLAYLPEKFQPSRQLRGYEYVSLALSYFGQKLERERAKECAKTLDLDPAVLDHKVGSYSKGMGQKLGLMGALLASPRLLLLDEPMSGLDPRARIHLKAALKAAKGEGRTVFFSSHILSDIDELCDRIGVLHEGELRYLGTPADLRSAQRASTLEQAFLGLIGG